MMVPAARYGSWEDVLHRAVGTDVLLCFNPGGQGLGIPGLDEPCPHRAIGVVYDPKREA
jgi:erythromycin esterase